MESVRELLIEEMGDLYDAEKQLVKALPKMAKAASSPQLKEAIESHLEETRNHVQRLEQAFQMLDQKAKGKPCEAMKGLIEEGKKLTEEDLSGALMDSAIIGAAQKVEHYEMAGYGTLCAWARSIGLEDVAELLDATLAEEKEADSTLTEVAGDVLAEAEEGRSEEDEEEVELSASSENAGAQRRKPVGAGAGPNGRSRRRTG